MQRLLIVLLAAVDAAVAAAVGLALLLAPLTLLWVFSFGATADWGALWPSAATLWQFGHAVPLDVTLPTAILREAGVAPDAASFVLSVPPLAFLVFTAVFAARSGRRAAVAGSWIAGVVSATVMFAAISALVMLTARIPLATTSPLLGVLAPTAVYLCGALVGALATAWADGDGGIVDRVHDAVDGWGEWAGLPGDAVRGAAVALTAVIGSAGLAVGVLALVRGGQIVTLFESLRVDALGATVVGLGQLAYVPTMVAWGVSWLAGPGFAVGTGTAVSPVGTELGVVPGIPMLGVLPEVASPWMLIVVLVPVAAGAFAGWIIRSRQVSSGAEPGIGARLATAAGIALLSAGGAALLAALSAGSIGPGRLAHAGPEPWAVALAIGLEVLVGAGILLLAPRHRDDADDAWLLGTDEPAAAIADSGRGDR